MKNLLLLVVIVLFSACGGGGTSVEPEPLKTLYFIDAPVNGVDFKCANRVGVTGTKEVNGTTRSGVLQCRKGTITFSLGKLVLGSIESYKDGQEIRPQDLAHVPQDHIEDENVVKIALLLQSINENEDDNNITITKEIKNRLTIKSLTNFSIVDVEKLIKKLGKTPIKLNEVKKHLIRNSSISYEDSKPTISPFEVEISTSSPAGFTIGTISIDEGKSPLISLTLSGEGADNFQLNSDGTLLLLKKINDEKEYKLKVKAENIYGSVTQTVNLNFKIMDKVGVAQLDGILSNATIKIIKLNQLTNKEELVFQEKTSNMGTFNTHAKELDDDTFYIFEATNGIERDKNTTNKGAIRLITKGEWIKNSNGMIHITPLSEMQYDYVVKYIKDVDSFDYNKIETILNESSRVLLSEDLTGDKVINTEDIIGFNPIFHQNSLYKTIKNYNFFQKITNKIYNANMTYIKDFFSTSIIKSFENTDDFKVVGSFAYVYGNNYFYIYDIFNQKKLGKIYLPKKSLDGVADILTAMGIPIENKTTVSISLSLDKNYIFLSNLDANLVIINIQDLNNPKLIAQQLIGTGKHIIGEFNNMLFFTQGLTAQDAESYGEEVKGFIAKDTKVVNIENISNPTIINNPNIPYFNKIINFKNSVAGVVFSKKSCLETNELDILTYNLVEKNNLSNFKLRKLPVRSCDSFVYIDKKGIIYASYFQLNSLDIYKIVEELYQAKYYTTLDYGSTLFVVNRYENTLYLSDLTDILFVNIKNLDNPYIYDKIHLNFSQDNLYFQGDSIFTTKKHIIDTQSYKLTSQYVTLQEDFITDENGNNLFTTDNLKLELFKKFSD